MIRNILALICILLLQSCTRSKNAPEGLASTSTETSTSTSSLATVSASSLPEGREFAYQVYRSQAKEPNNILISPLSLKFALSLVHAGLSGKSKETYESLLGLKSELDTFKSDLELVKNHKNIKIANSVWAKDNKLLTPEYIEAIKVLNAETEPLSVTAINSWVQTVTEKKLLKLIDQLSPDTLLVLVNALYFKAEWAKPFKAEATLDGRFQSSPHASYACKLMKQVEKVQYHEDSVAKWIKLNYEKVPFSMLFALPLKPEEMPKLEQALSSDTIATVQKKMKSELTEIVLPKFKIEGTTSVKPLLLSAGYTKLFEQLDLSRMTLNKSLNVSDFLQATFIQVDEKGTEAAAASGVMVTESMIDLALAKNFYADRPFVFILLNHDSGEIYFIGKVMKPE